MENIKKVVLHYIKKFNTNNPYEIADNLNIIVQKGNLGSCLGCYIFLKRHRCIFLNSSLDHVEQKIVMCHELGHAILHVKTNCCFMANKTLLNVSKIEREANIFAAELLMPDDIIKEYSERGYTLEQIAEAQQVNKELVNLKFENLKFKSTNLYAIQ